MSLAQQNIDILKANVIWHFELIGVQIKHADTVKGREKSGYYKVAILLASATAEALAHAVLRAKLAEGILPPSGGWECYESYFLPDSHQNQNTPFRLSICKRHKVIFELTDKTDFIRVNEVSKELGIFSEAFFKKMEKVRKMRNKIHIQSLDSVDRSYNKEQLDSIGYVVNKLIDKLP